LGAGAGFPGLALAAALASARVDLIESVGRKTDFIGEAIAAAGIANARAIGMRSEEWPREPPPAGGREAYDAVTARAIGPLAVIAELAAPLLRECGVRVARKGRPHPMDEPDLEAASSRFPMTPEHLVPVRPSPPS